MERGGFHRRTRRRTGGPEPGPHRRGVHGGDGYDPRAERGTKPFLRGNDTPHLAEAVGIGTTDLSRIEVAGLIVREVYCDYGPGATG